MAFARGRRGTFAFAMRLEMGRRFITLFSLRFFFFLLPLAAPVGYQTSLVAAAGQDEPALVRVGVILNMASTTGMRWRTVTQMAVEDYYAAHPKSTNRVELHFRDSSGDAVGAASAAVDLIKNAQVQAIVGPESSAEAEFVATIGSRAHVPVLSSSATSPALSPSQTPFFVRTAPDDSSQAAPIAAILGAFGWRAAVLVHEDSRYGMGIPLTLADALQGVGARVVDRTAVPAEATDDRLDAVLYRFMAMPTRVFVVHMSPPLAARLFHRARNAGMMSEGYMWIATAGVGSVVSTLNPQDIDAMQGLVCVRPYVPAKSQASNFAARFKARFRQENPGSQHIQNPAVTTLWAYDTAWAVAAAAEAAGIFRPAFQTPKGSKALTELDQLGVSATGTTLLKAVLNITFDGRAGTFRLVNGQRQQPAYEIVNVVGKGTRTVGFWTPESTTISQDSNANGGKGLRHIVWPGEPPHSRVPKGWDVSPNGRQLQIAVPVKHGFDQFVDVSNDSTTGRPRITGYCIDVFDAVVKALPYPVNYQYVPFNGSSESYDQLVRQVPEQKADAVVGDVTITSSRMGEVDFTTPFTESGWSMVVPMQTHTSTSMFFFLQPLTASLWLASLAFFVFTGFIVWVIEHRINPEFRGTPWTQFGLIFYYAFSTLVFAHREKLESNLSRFMVIIWVFVVLILTSSYTASLTSMLTVQKLEPTVTDVKELVRRGDYVGYQEGSFVPGMLKKMNFDESKLRSYSTPDQYADALSKGSANGGVAAIFDEIPYLKLFLSQYCDGYTMVGPTYKVAGFGFIFPKGSPMVPDVSRAIVSLTEGDEMALIERKWFGEPGACDSQSSSVGSSSLSFWSFGGLLLVTGVASGLMLIIYLVTFIYRERDELRAVESGGGSMSLRRLRAWLQHYDRKDLKFPTFKTWNDESMRNGSDVGNRTPRWIAESPRNGGGANRMRRAGEEEEAIGGTSPFSVSVCSEMNAGSSPEETPASELGNSFEQRIEEAATSVEMARPTASEV